MSKGSKSVTPFVTIVTRNSTTRYVIQRNPVRHGYVVHIWIEYKIKESDDEWNVDMDAGVSIPGANLQELIEALRMAKAD